MSEQLSSDDRHAFEASHARVELAAARKRIAELDLDVAKLRMDAIAADIWRRYALQDGDSITLDGNIRRQAKQTHPPNGSDDQPTAGSDLTS